MALSDRIKHATGGDIAVHKWTAGFALYAIGEATRNELIAVFDLSVEDQVGLDALKSNYDSLSTAIEKAVFLSKIEWAGLFYEDGTIDIDRYKQILGM